MRVSLLIEVAPGDGVIVEREIECAVGSEVEWPQTTAMVLMDTIEEILTSTLDNARNFPSQ
jgi:hypothetical protein